MITLSAIALATTLFNAHAPSQRELNGFFLGQYTDVISAIFDEPFQTEKVSDGEEIRIYNLDSDKHAFMAFTCETSDSGTITAIQLTGMPGTDMSAFDGLKLGADRDEVLKVLGKPDSEEDMSDIPGKFLSFDDRNYSVELDEKGRLSSIKIMGFNGFDKYKDQLPDIKILEHALKEKDVDEMLDVLMPDVEIYRGEDKDEAMGFSGPARTELEDEDSPMYKTLFDGDNSVRSTYAKEKSEPNRGLGSTEGKTILVVYSFKESKYLKEVVYRWQAGRWRVWEIRLA